MFEISNKLKVRAGYVLGHAATAAIIAHVPMWFWGVTLLEGAYSGLAALILGEVKERIGRLKEAGNFDNSILNSIKQFFYAQDSKWELWQTWGATLVFVVFTAFLDFIGLKTY